MIASALCCDICPNVFIADKPGTNSYLTRSANAAGWTSTKDINGRWSNTCDECTQHREATT